MLEEYVRCHYNENLNVESLAARFYYSRAYVSKLFRRETGQTYSNYLREMRLSRAMKDLCMSPMSIEEVGKRHGFTDTRHYINTFKKKYGVTPYQYRQKYKEVNDEIE